MKWHRQWANRPENFRLRPHDADELAHYSDECMDVEYYYPWGWDELEGVASRTDYDLKQHAAHSRTKLSYFDPNKEEDPQQPGKKGWRYVPYVIEPAVGLTRTLLCLLIDAYHEEPVPSSKSAEGDEARERVVLKLHPRLAPIKVAVLFPLVKKDGQPEMGQKLAKALKQEGLVVNYDDGQSIGKRYAKHDEIGTPFCITIDPQSLTDQTVTIRHRDDMSQIRMPADQVPAYILQSLKNA